LDHLKKLIEMSETLIENCQLSILIIHEFQFIFIQIQPHYSYLNTMSVMDCGKPILSQLIRILILMSFVKITYEEDRINDNFHVGFIPT